MLSHGVIDDETLAVLLVRWLEGRLHESVGFCMRGCRLYGLEVIDPHGLQDGDSLAARMSFVAEATDRESVVRHREARAAVDFDAAALVTIEWRPVAANGLTRPGQFAPRQRARVVELVCAGVGVTLVRFENDPDYIVLAPAG